jgi:hypothetical protein
VNTNERFFFFVYVYKRARCIFIATQQSIIDLTSWGGSSGHLAQLRVRDEAIDGKQGLQLHLHLHRRQQQQAATLRAQHERALPDAARQELAPQV